ncbi:unnamed protein product (macronuclear) [Paramecium tetraurelia]|uniref:Protein kinase domain-containing protein n=1 Tax=Paramecium tetraurelia TaxID=5888 RepID=A0BMQ9_PARTE|nr:uncharacterized protein GSPATT00030462001 [Paramecium tetraurelia]CAK59826.1 unnamed protein product [Paramecium tetraurelia]|eukprot:XP_001427224.1 hypothetical protein (macronuclear) [Paramecium tetraurelia strain d4-2]
MLNKTQINYDSATFHTICQRKHLLKDITYFLYIIDDTMILTNELESQQPKYQLQLNLETKIFWSIEKDRQLSQFGFEYKGSVKYFVAKDEELRKLKSHLRNRVMFKDVSDFYQPMKLLGKGGSSKVYLVLDKDNKQDFASKCVEKRYLKEDGGFQALFNEINLMATLDHDSVVKLEEVYEGENTFYLILEHLKGNSLHDLISKGQITQLSWDQIKSILWQILTGVARMHQLDIMHRDLKPENIMFKEANQIAGLRIVDFGLATSTQVTTYPFPKCGTPGYVAPEIANLNDMNFRYDKICDIFSVGCIFYKLITQKDLFPGNDYHEILKLNKKCIINLDNLSIYRTPQAAMELIQSMLQIDPKQRITAQQALEHPFFQGGFTDRKLKFQSQKKGQGQSKLWQTSTFRMEKSDKLQLPEIKQKSRQRDEDEVEDEKIKIKVPVMNSPRLAQHAKRKNLALADGSPTENPKKSAFKKFSTQEFDQQSPDTCSPDSARQHPTLIINNSPKLVQNQTLKRKFTYKNYTQHQAIYEVEDEQKNQ